MDRARARRRAFGRRRQARAAHPEGEVAGADRSLLEQVGHLDQDLDRHRRPSFVNHGTGITPHKRLFSNRASFDTQAFLFRPTFRNQFRCLSHGMFYKGLKLAKRIAGKRVTPAASELNEDD